MKAVDVGAGVVAAGGAGAGINGWCWALSALPLAVALVWMVALARARYRVMWFRYGIEQRAVTLAGARRKRAKMAARYPRDDFGVLDARTDELVADER